MYKNKKESKFSFECVMNINEFDYLCLNWLYAPRGDYKLIQIPEERIKEILGVSH